MTKSAYTLAIALLAFGCANEATEETDVSNFTRIYDNVQFSASYYPIDIRQTSDGGYIVLGGRRIADSNFAGIYLIRLDRLGAFVKDEEVDPVYVNPTGHLMELAGNYYFFCMTAVGLKTQLVELDESAEITQIVELGGSYPCAAAQDGDDFLLLSYDNENKLSVMSMIDKEGAVLHSKGFSIGSGEAVEEPIINHFIRTGRQYPFQVGKTLGGTYFFNGFYNYTFSLVFTDLAQDDALGVVQGQQDQGGLGQVQELTGGKFALSRFNFGDNYFLPLSELAATGISSSADLGGNNVPELTPNAPVRILKATIGSRNIVIYGSNTLSGQIALFNYDAATGELLGSKYLGFSNPFELASLMVTADGGLAVCGTTYVAGRFPRVCLFKISQEEYQKTIE